MSKRTGRGKSVEPQGAERERMVARAEQIADFYKVDPSQVRHAEYLEFTGEHWVMRECWERLIEGKWIEEPPFPGWMNI